MHVSNHNFEHVAPVYAQEKLSVSANEVPSNRMPGNTIYSDSRHP